MVKILRGPTYQFVHFLSHTQVLRVYIRQAVALAFHPFLHHLGDSHHHRHPMPVLRRGRCCRPRVSYLDAERLRFQSLPHSIQVSHCRCPPGRICHSAQFALHHRCRTANCRTGTLAALRTNTGEMPRYQALHPRPRPPSHNHARRPGPVVIRIHCSTRPGISQPFHRSPRHLETRSAMRRQRPRRLRLTLVRSVPEQVRLTGRIPPHRIHRH